MSNPAAKMLMPNPAVYNAQSTGVSTGDGNILLSLLAALESQSAWDQQRTDAQLGDQRSRAATEMHSFDTDSPLCFGKVLLAYPYLHCYRVQLSDRSGICFATAVGRGSHAPVGVKPGDVIPPNSDVIVWRPRTSMMAYILAVLPGTNRNDSSNLSDIIQQGGNSGVKKIEAYRNIVTAEAQAYGWSSQSCGRPMDGTLNEYVRMSETGIGLLIDSFQAYLRVNEACGLFLNYFDSTTKLAGLNLETLSYAVHDRQLYDEGEVAAIRGYATFPWEAAGSYGPAERFTQTNDAAAVQLDRQFPFATEDVIEPDQTPFYRLTEYHGYLGQGENKLVAKPPAATGPRLLRDAAVPDTGLFQSATTLDGGHSIRSAKYVILAKYPLIPNPRRKRQPEDQQGDDAENGEYRFSGQFGSGDEHKVREWSDADAELANMLRPASILDTLVRHHNWKSTHAFHYHTEDYVYPDESEGAELNAVQFARGRLSRSVVEVYPKKLRIDHRYGDATYYENASIFALAEDGSIVAIDGYGSRLFMGGGQIRLEASGDCTIQSGGRVVLMGEEVITRARKHVDISASDGDVRLKAERNMQLLAGNGGTGGMLLESKGTGTTQDYGQKIGDDVVASGITFLAKGGSVNQLSKEAYIRTGIATNGSEDYGSLVLDVANGRSQLVSYSSHVSMFSDTGLGLWMSPKGQGDPSIEKCTFFGPSYAHVNGPLSIKGNTVITNNGSLGVASSVFANDHVVACKYVAAIGGVSGIADSSKNNLPADVASFIRAFESFEEQTLEFGGAIFSAVYPAWWAESQPGNADLLANQIGFSYRDRSRDGVAYGYEADSFRLLETWWQTLGRMGYTDQGEAWTEKPVQYQGEKLYPWPGRKNWVEQSNLVAYGEADVMKLFDGSAAASRAGNQAAYEQPEYAGWQKRVCDGNYRL